MDCTVHITFILCLFTPGLYMTTLCIGCKLQVFLTLLAHHTMVLLYIQQLVILQAVASDILQCSAGLRAGQL